MLKLWPLVWKKAITQTKFLHIRTNVKMCKHFNFVWPSLVLYSSGSVEPWKNQHTLCLMRCFYFVSYCMGGFHCLCYSRTWNGCGSGSLHRHWHSHSHNSVVMLSQLLIEATALRLSHLFKFGFYRVQRKMLVTRHFIFSTTGVPSISTFYCVVTFQKRQCFTCWNATHHSVTSHVVCGQHM